MSSSFVKTKLKAAREALSKKDYPTAKDNASQVLGYEPENYNALVFLALSHLELGEHDDSEKTYRKAVDLQPKQILAWQGLAKFYERIQKWDSIADTLKVLADLFLEIQDATKCAESLQRLIEVKREYGQTTELVDALSLYLPSSPYHSLLSSLPPSDPTKPTATTTFYAQEAIHNSLPVLQEMVTLTEKTETRAFDQEYSKRRMRLNAPGPEQLKKEISEEVLGSSKLPNLYSEILNHPNTTDEERRMVESKFLRHRVQYLHALPTSHPKKSIEAQAVSQMADDAVLLGIPDQLAWKIHIENQDCALLKDYDHQTFCQYLELFPETAMSLFLQGYLESVGREYAHLDEEEAVCEDPFEAMISAFSSLQNDVFPTRVMAEIYSQDEDHQNAINLAEVGLELIRRIELNTTKKLGQVSNALKVILGTSLTHLHPPKHHRRALGIILEVLASEPDNVSCLMAQGDIMQAGGKWAEASELFSRVAELRKDDLDLGLRSREEAAWSTSRHQGPEVALSELNAVLELLDQQSGREADQARCLWRYGQLKWENSEKDESYKFFITCLKKDSGFAPAFTSLGFFYLEHASPPDSARASKCFQKAFELDATQTAAAQQLCRGFAEDQEWELVEVIARRTIEGEGGLGEGPKGKERVSARYLPANVWAWKAMGIVELVNRDYAAAIHAFQVALRANSQDAVSWIRLGEAYGRAGKQAAALKALRKAQELDPDDWLCEYFIGDVQRQVGQYEEAIVAFRSILEKKPLESGVLVLLAQCHLDLGRSELLANFGARAERSFVSCAEVALQIVRQVPDLDSLAWKLAGDALFCLAERTSFFDDTDVSAVAKEVQDLLSHGSDRVPRYKGSDGKLDGLCVLHAAIIAYDHRISLAIKNTASTSSAWYDTGMSLYLWRLRYPEDPNSAQAERESLKCVLEAIKTDSGNSAPWNLLGHLKFESEPKVAQHAYLIALEIDNKNVETWANLGLLYLFHSDIELAGQMFNRAQILDPDHTVTWIGQALLATSRGDSHEADLLFDHAATLSTFIPSADLNFACGSFKRLLRSSAPTALYPIFLVLNRYTSSRPDDITALNLFGLVAERLGHLEVAVEVLEKAIALLEAAYEVTEDATTERRFSIANSNLARVLLSVKAYERAQETFGAVLGLLAELPEEDAEGHAIKAQAHMGSALAHYHLGGTQEALEQLDACSEYVERTSSKKNLASWTAILLAKTLWASGTDDAREQAKGLLLERISNDPEDLGAIQALAGMGVLTSDEALVDAALTEIIGLPIDQRHELDPEREVDYLLKQYHLAQEDVGQALAVVQNAVHSEPARSSNRRELAMLLVQLDQRAEASAVLTRAGSGVEMLQAICHAKQDEALGLAQQVVMLRPQDLNNWRALALIRARSPA